MAVENSSYELEWYLDVEKGQTVPVSDYYDGEEGEDLQEMIESDDSGRFIPIPTRSSREEWEQMERFILAQDDQDEKIIERLLTTIQGSGAFGRFRDAIYRIGLEKRWYEFKNRKEAREALEWLFSVDLIEEDDIERGMELHEQLVAKRKRRDEDVKNMVKDSKVRCTDNVGHMDKLTKGKIYEVLEERPEQLNIRIKDDRGKICWFPKAHFELMHVRKV